MSSPAWRIFSFGSASICIATVSSGFTVSPRSSSSVSSNATTASAFSGTGAPVIIRIAVPGFKGWSAICPAATTPMTGNTLGAFLVDPVVSEEKTAYPSMAEFVS